MDRIMNFRKILLNLSLSLIIVLVVISCVEPYPLDIKTSKYILVIDGKLDDSDKEKYITIRKSDPFSLSFAGFLPVEEAKVEIIENNNTVIPTQNKPGGYYYLPPGTKAKIGSTYQLKVTLSTGEKYESSVETMRNTPEISDIKAIFSNEAIKNGDKKIPGHFIYIDTKDNPEKGDYYIWSYRFFEKQSICKTCYGGIFITNPLPEGSCLGILELQQTNNIYDYLCQSECWEILYSKELNIMSDVYSNSNEIKNRLVAKIPYYFMSGFLIEITQQNVDVQAFNYLKILLEQNQTNGALADSPPAPLIGNIKNINDKNEIIGGYFMVVDTKIKKLYVQRSYKDNANPIGLLGERKMNLEPPNGTRPPLAPCIKSYTRTPLAPEGWPKD